MAESKLTKSEQARIERNRQRALLLRSSIIARRAESTQNLPSQDPTSRVVDSGGGFLLDFEDTTNKDAFPVLNEDFDDDSFVDIDNVLLCGDCGTKFIDSFLWKKFSATVCDGCRGRSDGKNDLITKTDAKTNFLLKDYDFDNRGVALKYISKKNPHNPFSTEMRLYFKPQILELARKVWGTLEKLADERGIRKAKSEKIRHKKLEKRVKELRRAVRTSTWHKDTKAHEHEFDEEKYDEENDIYMKSCKSCGHTVEFEKM